MVSAVVLGSGTSHGIPTLGVEYTPEYLSNPRNHRMRPSLLLRGPGGNVLVDCTPEMRLQLLRAKVMMIEGVIITHTHADHIMGMDDLRSFSLRSRKDMPIYTLPRYQEDIRRIYPYAFQEFPAGIDVPRFELIDVPEELFIAGMTIRVMQVEHGNLPVLSLRIGDFAYVTDVSRIPAAAEQYLFGLQTLVLDAVRFRPHANHFHLERAIEVAQQLGAKQTFFTHLSDDYDHDATNLTLPDGIALAYDGLEIDVKV